MWPFNFHTIYALICRKSDGLQIRSFTFIHITDAVFADSPVLISIYLEQEQFSHLRLEVATEAVRLHVNEN